MQVDNGEELLYVVGTEFQQYLCLSWNVAKDDSSGPCRSSGLKQSDVTTARPVVDTLTGRGQ
jgi:hypothetical protein